MNLRVWLQSRTRSQMFLWQMTLGILAAGFAVAAGLQLVHRPDADPSPMDFVLDNVVPLVPLTGFGDDEEGKRFTEELRRRIEQGLDVAGTIEPWLAAHATDIGRVLGAMPALTMIASFNRSYDLEAAVREAMAAGEGRDVVIEYLRSIKADVATASEMLGDSDREPESAADSEAETARAEPTVTPALRQMADRQPPVRWANQAIAMRLAMGGRMRQAGEAFEREGRLPGDETAEARRLAVRAYMEAEAYDALERLRDDPAFAGVMTASVSYHLALHDRDWLGVLRWIWPAQFDLADPGYIALGVCSGVFWLLFLLHVGEVRRLGEVRLWLCVAGVALGAISVAPTLFLVVWEEQVLGWTPSSDLHDGLIYYFAGVGLREELCKLLMVLPLAPILVRRGNALEMLVVCSCVGLGFAAEENIAYFAGSIGSAAPGRFLTANFLHLAMTGLAGFALCQMLYKPRERAGDFAVVFVGVVVLHGLYDATISIPALGPLRLAGSIIFVLLAYQYFNELHQYRRWTARTISLTAVFLGGFATLIALTYNYVAWTHGLVEAADAMVPAAIGSAIIIILYLRQINEPLSP